MWERLLYLKCHLYMIETVWSMSLLSLLKVERNIILSEEKLEEKSRKLLGSPAREKARLEREEKKWRLKYGANTWNAIFSRYGWKPAGWLKARGLRLKIRSWSLAAWLCHLKKLWKYEEGWSYWNHGLLTASWPAAQLAVWPLVAGCESDQLLEADYKPLTCVCSAGPSAAQKIPGYEYEAWRKL